MSIRQQVVALPSFSRITLPISCVSKGSLFIGVPNTKQLKSFNDMPSEKIDCVPKRIFLSLFNHPPLVSSLSVKTHISCYRKLLYRHTDIAHAFRKATLSDTTNTLCPSAAYFAAIILTLWTYSSVVCQDDLCVLPKGYTLHLRNVCQT